MHPESQNIPPPVSEATPAPAHTESSTPAAEQAEVPTPTAAWTPSGEDVSTLPPIPLVSSPVRNFRFGPYLILSEIAQGGMGVVYRARHTALGREVALKTIHGIHQVKPEFVSRFYQEAQAVAQLKHPHIIQVFDFGLIDGQHYFTMGLAQDGSLLSNLDRYVKDPRAAILLMEKVARAVQHIHENGLLHRDLKPGNILLDDGEPLVSDFGLAKSLELDLELTRTGSAIGTPSYMAPEQAAGRGNLVCPQTDVWALGVILYELVCGRKPFTGDSREEVVRAIQEDEAAAPRSVRKGLDRNLEAILLKCLEKTPAHRYVSAGALADDLGAWLRGEPLRVRPPGPVSRFVRRCRKHPVLTGTALFAFCALAALAIIIPRLDPEHEIRPVQGQLINKEPVTLLGQLGPPNWRRWQVPGAIFVDKPGETFALHSGSPSLLELLPDPQTSSFVFSAEIRQEPGDAGRVGVYLAHSAEDLPDGRYHAYLLVFFSDWGADARDRAGKWQGLVQMRAHHFQQPQVGNVVSRVADLIRPLPFRPRAAGAEEEWRRITLDVSDERIVVYFDKKVVGTLTTQTKALHARGLNMQRMPPGRNLDLHARGGLGLYLDNCIASFRNVTVTPQ